MGGGEGAPLFLHWTRALSSPSLLGPHESSGGRIPVLSRTRAPTAHEGAHCTPLLVGLAASRRPPRWSSKGGAQYDDKWNELGQLLFLALSLSLSLFALKLGHFAPSIPNSKLNSISVAAPNRVQVLLAIALKWSAPFHSAWKAFVLQLGHLRAESKPEPGGKSNQTHTHWPAPRTPNWHLGH